MRSLLFMGTSEKLNLSLLNPLDGCLGAGGRDCADAGAASLPASDNSPGTLGTKSAGNSPDSSSASALGSGVVVVVVVVEVEVVVVVDVVVVGLAVVEVVVVVVEPIGACGRRPPATAPTTPA